MWLHFIFILIIPFSLLFWLNTSIYRKLSEQAVMLRRTGQKHLRRRETRLGKGRVEKGKTRGFQKGSIRKILAEMKEEGKQFEIIFILRILWRCFLG